MNKFTVILSLDIKVDGTLGDWAARYKMMIIKMLDQTHITKYLVVWIVVFFLSFPSKLLRITQEEM